MTNISIFGQNIDFYQNLFFREKSELLTKIFEFRPKFRFLPKFRFVSQISIFD